MAKQFAENHPEYEINVQALMRVQPKDLDASEIEIRLGATWIDPGYINDFMGEIFKTPKYALGRTINVKYAQVNGQWNISGKNADNRREDLCRKYNELFNSTRPREYDGSHIRFVGMTPEITLMQHQKNAVAHILYGHNTLLAHCVGAGKTYQMIAAGMESKRLGLSQKNLYVVPNHLTEQWGSDFLRLYPGANVLVAMFMKCRYLDELTGGRGVTFATGTPVSNSMVELYTIMRYLQYDTLQKMGLGHFDSWASTFGETVTAIEIARGL